MLFHIQFFRCMQKLIKGTEGLHFSAFHFHIMCTVYIKNTMDNRALYYP